MSINVWNGDRLVDTHYIADFVNGWAYRAFGTFHIGLAEGVEGGNGGRPAADYLHVHSVHTVISPIPGIVGLEVSGTYYFEGVEVGDRYIDFRGGIPLYGRETGESIYGFDFDPETNTTFNDRIYGNGGDDTLFGEQGNDTLSGGVGQDILHGGDGNDLLQGDAGNDLLLGEAGVDTIDGGDGTDTAGYDFSGQTEGVLLVNGNAPDVTYQITAGNAVLGSIRNVEITGSLTGGSGNDRIGGVYSYEARTAGSYTSPIIRGGAGTDTFVLDASAGGTYGGTLGAGGSDSNYSFITSGDRLAQFTVYGDVEAIEFTGSTTATGITGGIGNDVLIGLGGNDVFRGGDGDDTLSGGQGNNTLDGGAGQNTTRFNFSSAFASVARTSTGFIVDGPGSHDVITNVQTFEFADRVLTDPTVANTKLPGSALFDRAYYLATNPSVAATGIDPLQHYMTVGWTEGRNPSALFNTTYYLNQNADVRAVGMNPLTHFENYGWREGRDPSTGFSLSNYLAAYADVAAAQIDPLKHYIAYGQPEGRTAFSATPHATGPANPLVDAAYVYAHNPAVATDGLDASAWYAGVGWAQGANPSAFFDTSYYLAQNADVRAAHINPLAHFADYGWREGRQPSLVFDDTKYLNANADVRAANLNPLLHYMTYGQTEGRMAFLTGEAAPADPLIDPAYYLPQQGATSLPSGVAASQLSAWSYDHGGWQQGLNPNPLFDSNYYLAHNLDVAAAHINPLLHYEEYGWREHRNPSAAFSSDRYLTAYADVRAAGVNPLLHYTQYGQFEGRIASPV